MGGQKDDDERRPEVWAYEGPTADGSPRFKVGDLVEMSGVGGPYPVTGVGWDGDWVYALQGPIGHRAIALCQWLRSQRADGRWQDVSHFPQTHLRFSRRPS